MSVFIAFEGIEGCGKTTQVGKAADYLTKRGIPFLCTVEPGGTGVGEELRNILLNKVSLRIHQMTELFLFAADRIQHVEEVILPALRSGTVVLCDRFADATVAYQGYGRELDIDVVRAVNRWASGSATPDMTILIDLPVEVGLERAKNRSVRLETPDDRFERERVEFHRRVRAGYLRLAGEEPDRFRLIDGTRGIDAIHEEIRGHIARLLAR
ncbi:MAG: dTMP kinase [Deltaproteobacteria bacterium]|nr:dTMP kinase [Deltaproteobacteria bacterium]